MTRVIVLLQDPNGQPHIPEQRTTPFYVPTCTHEPDTLQVQHPCCTLAPYWWCWIAARALAHCGRNTSRRTGVCKKSATQGCSEFAQGAMSHKPNFGVWPLWNFCRGLQGLPMSVRGVSNRALVVAWREFEVGQECVFRVMFYFRPILKHVSITTHPFLLLCVGMCLHAP